MDRQTIRLIFLVTIFFVGMQLYTTWQLEQSSGDVTAVSSKDSTNGENAVDKNTKINNSINSLPTIESQLPDQDKNLLSTNISDKKIPSDRLIKVKTDSLDLHIDLLGGDFVYLALPQYLQQPVENSPGYSLLDTSSDRYYVAQSGLLSDDGPDSYLTGKGLYTSQKSEYYLTDETNTLNVTLEFKTKDDVVVKKVFTFKRGSYIVDVVYHIQNNSDKNFTGSFFGQLTRNKPQATGGGPLGAMKSYTGAAVSTPDKKYEKISFDDIHKKPYKKSVSDGWIAMIEHYFTSAWIPSPGGKYYFQTEELGSDNFAIRFIAQPTNVAPGQSTAVGAKLYAGPEVTSLLKEASPGLELTIDYGFLWFLCQPIFILLKQMFDWVKNWGVAIILTTVVIKLLFYRLSAKSYKSMGNMRKLQPRIEALKEKYGEDKQKMNQAMWELYRREKVNPLGGCLPILVQIPVFIALYYVLLESVELRHAPFALWITDLSVKDPYYVLPIVMGLSMLVQQRLNPAPPDPIQAKVMMFMPVVFTFLFLNFPAGLVLYWVVNNVLSILQQWYITRRIEAGTG